MEEKIKTYFQANKLGRVKSIKEVEPWRSGRWFHVKISKFLINEFTVYELDGEVETARNLQMNKTF